MLERILLVGVLIILIMAGCARHAATEIAHGFNGEFEAEVFEALNMPDEVTVTKRVNGDTVFSERIETANFDDKSMEAEFERHGEVDIDDVTDVNFDFGDGGITFEGSGTNHEGETVNISADLTKGNNSVVNIDVSN